MTTTEAPPAALALGRIGIPYRLFRHVGPVASLEQAAIERGQTVEQVIRSILFRLPRRPPADGMAHGRHDAARLTGSEFVMVLMAGPAQISWPALRAYLGRSRISMAGEDEVLSATGYRVGAVSPFGLPAPIRTLVDEAVFTPEEVSIGSGVRGVSIILRTDDLRRALAGAEVGRFS
jgi:Cys-tRNA(Pro)/Cys-tRNA(Cys) deacylase